MLAARPRPTAGPPRAGSPPNRLDPPIREDWEGDWDVFTRSDLLMSAHQQMAYTDLTSRPEVHRVLRSILEQLANLALRRETVETRLHEIRAAIVQQYRDQPGRNPGLAGLSRGTGRSPVPRRHR